MVSVATESRALEGAWVYDSDAPKATSYAEPALTGIAPLFDIA